MSTYPGENPQEQPEGEQPADAGDHLAQTGQTDPGDQGDTEPTQPVGYWERRAAEQARQQTQQGDPDPSAAQGGAVFNPTSVQPPTGWEPGATRPYEQDPYGQPAQPGQPGQPGGQPPYAQPTYGQPAYGQPAYGPPAYGQQPYRQPAYGQQPSYGYPPPGYPPYAGFTPPAPTHNQANTSLILGICGLAFGFLCGIGFFASPFAWALGHNAVKEIRASQGRLGGEGTAKAGMITGIIGTVILLLGLLGLIVFAVLVFVGGSTSGSNV